MTQNLPHTPHVETKANHWSQRHLRTRVRADLLMREIAFVLKMTERVRNEIEAKKESEEFVAV